MTWVERGLAAPSGEGFERVLSSGSTGESELSAAEKYHGYPERTKIGVGCWRYARSLER